MRYYRAIHPDVNNRPLDLLVQEKDNSYFVYSDRSDVFSNLAQKPISFFAPLWYIEQIKPYLVEVSIEEFNETLNDKDKFEGCETIDIEKYDYPTKLLHGTDAKIIRMSDEDRKSYRSCCEKAIKYLYSYYEQNFCFGYNRNFRVEIEDIDEETKSNVENALKNYQRMLDGRKLWQYPDGTIYFTTVGKNAKDYAYQSFAGGEFGYIAYYLCKAALCKGFPELHPDKETQYAIQRVLEFGGQKREPICFIIESHELDLRYLRSETGDLLSSRLEQNFRYSGSIKLDLSTTE